MKIVAVLHTEKVEGLLEKPAEIAVNPTLTVNGMEKAHEFTKTLRLLGPFAGCYCSRLARTSDIASVFCLALDLDFQTMKGLGQYASKEGDTIVYYPGHEKESFHEWQQGAVQAVEEIYKKHVQTDTVLLLAHGPTVAGLIGQARAIYSNDALKQIVRDLRSRDQKFVTFEMDNNGIRII